MKAVLIPNKEIDILEEAVHKLVEIYWKLLEDDTEENYCSQRLLTIIKELDDQIIGKSKTIKADMEVLGLQTAILMNPERMVVRKSDNDLGLIEILKMNRMCRRIFGYRNMATLMVQFQVQVGGVSRTIRVPQQQLRWFW